MASHRCPACSGHWHCAQSGAAPVSATRPCLPPSAGPRRRRAIFHWSTPEMSLRTSTRMYRRDTASSRPAIRRSVDSDIPGPQFHSLSAIGASPERLRRAYVGNRQVPDPRLLLRIAPLDTCLSVLSWRVRNDQVVRRNVAARHRAPQSKHGASVLCSQSQGGARHGWLEPPVHRPADRHPSPEAIAGCERNLHTSHCLGSRVSQTGNHDDDARTNDASSTTGTGSLIA